MDVKWSPCVYLTLFYLLIPLVSSQQTNGERLSTTTYQCDCMEYWQCVGAGGNPYSYCSFSNKVCCFIDPDAENVGILPRTNKVVTCGEKGVDSNREGLAEPGEWSWHAAILEKPRDLYVCGASLLDEQWVLTAAHCVDDYRTVRFLKVRLGEYDVSTISEPWRHEEFDIAKIVLHPGFDNNTLIHDIALLQLATPARKKPNINTVCIPDINFGDKELHTTSRCYVTGWGKRTEASEHSLILKEVNVPLWKRNDCERALKQHFGPQYKLPDTSICAGREGRDACDGDGGGPLSCEKKGHWYQVGIVSFGIGCGRPNTPGVYTRVGSYRNWIRDVVLHS
ncbi:phenoloxidase-activating factor 2-like [Tachypleus tridentatus]|uniref:phenoloxidase-activating factor 2-like n=1 Tax=Tachypleus tridentatus TaxID=6853 RepID=UPI003FD0540C